MKPPVNRGHLALGAYVYAVLAFIIIPLVIVIPMSVSTNEYLEFPPTGFTLKWYAEYFSDRQWWRATILSLQVAALTAVCASVIGTAATYAMVRGRGRVHAERLGRREEVEQLGVLAVHRNLQVILCAVACEGRGRDELVVSRILPNVTLQFVYVLGLVAAISVATLRLCPRFFPRSMLRMCLFTWRRMMVVFGFY